MKNIQILHRPEYGDASLYTPTGNGVYHNTATNNYNITFCATLEDDEDTQYPLEDILDKYYLNCTGYLEEVENNGKPGLRFELEGSLRDPATNLQNIQAVATIAGKRVYNLAQNGREQLIIE